MQVEVRVELVKQSDLPPRGRCPNAGNSWGESGQSRCWDSRAGQTQLCGLISAQGVNSWAQGWTPPQALRYGTWAPRQLRNHAHDNAPLEIRKQHSTRRGGVRATRGCVVTSRAAHARSRPGCWGRRRVERTLGEASRVLFLLRLRRDLSSPPQ